MRILEKPYFKDKIKSFIHLKDKPKSMNILDYFNDEFIKRHDFCSEDLKTLFSKWDAVKFKNIPEAWIIIIDNMLLKFKEYNMIPKCIEQSFGQLIVFWNFKDNISQIQEDIIKSTSEELKLIDEDLYLYFDIGMDNIKMILPTYH